MSYLIFVTSILIVCLIPFNRQLVSSFPISLTDRDLTIMKMIINKELVNKNLNPAHYTYESVDNVDESKRSSIADLSNDY